MLLQTNSYIVPKERRAEHARLIRRFRQALARIGCDQFEVYEQVGANWSPGGANGRYVQIMRFRDRQHQQAVQAAERNDHGAQQIIAEFCDLINFPYQQEHGYFATGFYTSVLPTGPRQAADYEPVDTDEEPEAANAPVAEDPFIVGGAAQEVPTEASSYESTVAVEDETESQPAAEPSISAISDSETDDLGEAESLALAQDSAIEQADAASSAEAHNEALGAEDLMSGGPEAPRHDRLPQAQPAHADAVFSGDENPAIDTPNIAAEEATVPEETAPSSAASQEIAELTEIPSVASPEESFPALAQSTEPAASNEWAGGGDLENSHSGPAEPQPNTGEYEIDGLIFEDEIPELAVPAASASADNAQESAEAQPSPADEVRPTFVDETATARLPDKPVEFPPHEEFVPPMPDAYLAERNAVRAGAASVDEAELDSLLDDANLLDNVPFPGALEQPPRLHSRREAGGNGHNGAEEKEAELLEFESFIRQLDEDPSADHGRRAQ